MLRHPAYYDSNALITSFISEKLVELSGNSFQRKTLASPLPCIPLSGSGTDRTGRRSARDATTEKRGERTVTRRIGIEGDE